MKRSSFLSALSSIAGLLIFPLKGVASFLLPGKGYKVKAGNDRFDKPITLLEGDTFYTKVSSKDTEGRMYMFESTRVKKGGPTHHFHYEQDEIWYILEGEFLFKIGEETHTAKAGDTIFGPKGIPHSFSKVNEGIAKMIIIFEPAGKMEEFFIAVAAGKLKDLSVEQQNIFRKEHGFESVGPGIGYQKKF